MDTTTATAAPAPAPWRPGRAELFAACVPVVMLVVTGVLVALGYGAPDSRAALGLNTPAVTVTTVTGPAVESEEDAPGWDCRVQGNRVCGVLAPSGGPTLRTTGIGGVRVVCPAGGHLVDIPTGRGCAY